MSIIYIALGGAAGAVLRYLVGLIASFPFGTLTVNVIGSFLIGLAFVYLSQVGLARWQPLIMTGVLGGFTTFSAFSLDALRLYDAGRLAAAGGYVAASVAFSLAAVFLGVTIARGFTV